jgi:hypothetical protein
VFSSFTAADLGPTFALFMIEYSHREVTDERETFRETVDEANFQEASNDFSRGTLTRVQTKLYCR